MGTFLSYKFQEKQQSPTSVSPVERPQWGLEVYNSLENHYLKVLEE